MKNRKVLMWPIAIAPAGCLFGFDTDVIPAAEQKLQKCRELALKTISHQ